MKAILSCLGVALLFAALLGRYDLQPLPAQDDGSGRFLCLRLDRWTGRVEVGRQYTVGPPGGQRMTGAVWEPVRGSIHDLGQEFRRFAEQ